jgi:hypothetical protein
VPSVNRWEFGRPSSGFSLCGVDCDIVDLVIGQLKVEHIGDKALGPVDAGHFQQLIEHLARWSDQRHPVDALVVAWGLPNKRQLARHGARQLGRDMLENRNRRGAFAILPVGALDRNFCHNSTAQATMNPTTDSMVAQPTA